MSHVKQVRSFHYSNLNFGEYSFVCDCVEGSCKPFMVDLRLIKCEMSEYLYKTCRIIITSELYQISGEFLNVYINAVYCGIFTFDCIFHIFGVAVMS